MNKKVFSIASFLVLALSTLGACSFSQNSGQSQDKQVPKTFELPNLIIGSNNNIESSNGNSSLEIRDGKLVNKASDANPLPNATPTVIPQPNDVANLVTASATPNPTPTSSSSIPPNSGQLNIQINPNLPIARGSL